MSEPFPNLLTPEQRRRANAARLAAQYDRPTPQDTTVVERAGLLPLGTYANGMTGLAFPGFLADPVSGFIREATNPVPYLNRSEDEKRQTVETGFDVAGAAMVGGLAAPKPSNVVGSAGGKLAGEGRQGAAAGAALSGAGERPSLLNRMLSIFGKKDEPLIGYRGSPFEGGHTRDFYWASADKGMASDYAMVPGNDKSPNHSPNVTPAEFRFKNPMTVDAQGDFWDYIRRDGTRTSTDGLADDARFAGHDGIIIKNVSDPIGHASDAPQTTIAALKRGTVYSPLTGDLLYANGGRQGAAAGAALSSAERPQTVRAYRGSNGEFDLAQFDPSASSQNWRTNEGALFFGSQDVGNFYGQPQTGFDQALYSSIVKKHTKPDGRLNPQAIAKEYEAVAPQEGMASVMPADINTSNFGNANLFGYRWDADEGARLKARIDAAKAQGKDGLVINGMMDASGYPDTQYAVWGRGNVTSPLTGDLLYANGGRQGAAAGAALQAPNDPAINELLRQYGIDLPRRNWSNAMLPGDA